MMSDNTFPFSTKHLFIALLVFVLLMKASLFTQKIVDWDEIVYLYLSEHMGWLLTHYTTQGSFIEKALTHNVYHAPVFSHPPLMPYLIKLASLVFAPVTAAKAINLCLAFLSFFLVYDIARLFSDTTGALLATALWAVCPIFNLESSLVHLDFPLAVFLLLGLWLFLRYRAAPEKRHYLFLSALAFVLAMLTKYTGPLYVLVPLALLAAVREDLRGKRDYAVFLAILLPGFVWWLYVLLVYGSPAPHDFIGYRDGKVFSTPYLRSIANRTWYDLWIYFAAICPLFIVYLGAAGHYLVQLVKAPRFFSGGTPQVRMLAAANAAIVASTAAFSVINAFSNGYWTMRHIFPIYPMIYITIGCIVSRLTAGRDGTLNAYLLVLVLMTLFLMSASTMLTMFNPAGLKPLPALYFLIPGLNASYL